MLSEHSSRDGFRPGDEVEVRLPRQSPKPGRVVDISPDRLPVVEFAGGGTWNCRDEWLTRVG